MANTIQIKRNTSGVPSGLAAGELAVNLSDNKLYVGNAAEDGVIHLNPSASGTLTSTGDFTIDSGDGIILDADGGAISLKDGGTRFGVLENSSSNFVIQNPIDDKDILFKIKDGGTVKTALTLDGSENGNATFGGTITANTAGNTTSGATGYYGSLIINNTGSNTWSRFRFDRSNVEKWGIGVDGSDVFRISNLFTGGTAASPNDNCLVINNSSNVGINCTPSFRLHVGGTFKADDLTTLTTNSSGYALKILENSGGEYFQLGVNQYGGLEIYNETTKCAEWYDTGDFKIPDNIKILLGTGDDLKIYHDGSHARINNATGNLNIQANDFHLTDSSNTAVSFIVDHDGATGLYFNQSARLTTTSTGATVSSGSSSQTATSGADELKVEGADHTGISILAPAAKRAQLYFNDDAFLRWVENDGVLSIDTSSSSSKISLAPSGAKVGINVTDPAAPLNVVSAYSASATTTAIKVSTVGGYNATSGVSIDFGNDQGNYATWLTGQIASRKDGGSWQGSLVFSVNNNSSATDLDEKLKITSSLTTLSSDLQVGNSVSGETQLVTFNSEGGAEVGLTVKSRTNRAKLRVADNDTSAYIVAENSVLGFGAAAQASANNFNILSSGFAALGTTAPTSLLHLYNSSTSGNTQLHIHNDKTGDAAVLKLEGKRTGGSDAGQVLFANNSNSIAMIRSHSSGDDGDLKFYTSPSGSGSALTERLTIASAGATTIKSGGNSSYPFAVISSLDSDKIFGVYQDADGDGAAYVLDKNNSSKVGLSSNGNSWFTGGNLGLGSVSPSSLLHLYSSAPVLTIQDGGTWGTNATGYIELKDGSSTMSMIGVTGTAGHLDIKHKKAGSIRMFTNDAERLTIASAGRVTFSGTTGADGVVIAGGESNNFSARLFFDNGVSGESAVIRNENGAMQFLTAGTPGSSSGTKRAIISNAALYPNDNGFSLGLTSKRWLIYGTAGDFSGDLTTGSTANDAPLFQNIVKSGTVIARLTANRAGGDAVVGTNSAHDFLIQRGGDTRLTLSGSSVVVNDTGANIDFRVEGDGDQNLIRTDASNDRVGIKTAAPAYTFHCVGTGYFSQSVTLSSGLTATGAIQANGGFITERADNNNFITMTATGNESWTIAGRSGSDPNDYLDIGCTGGGKISIHESGALGINVAAPTSRLHLKDSVDNTFESGLCIERSADAAKTWINTKGGATNFNNLNNAGSSGLSYKWFANGSQKMELNPSNGLIIGADDIGLDVRFYGATSGRYWEWDESDDLVRQRDGVKTTFGNGTDLMIWHDGSNSYLQQGSNGGNLNFTNSGGTKFSAIFKHADAVELYFNGSKKFETLNTGVKVTGTLQADVLNNAANSANIIYRSGSSTIVGNNANALVVLDNGNTGLGTVSPTSKLHVTGDLGNSAFLAYIYNSGTQSEDNGLNVQIASSGSSAMGLRVNTGGDSNAFIVAGDGDTGLGFTPSNFAQKLNVNGGAYINGNLGLGRSSPSARLDILDPTDGGISWSTFLRVGRRSGDSTNELELKSLHDGSDEVDGFAVFLHGGECLAVDHNKRLFLNALPPGTYAEATYADDFVLGDTGNHAGMTIRSGTSHAGSIYFADGVTGDQKYRGYIEYNHNGDLMSFGAGAGGRLRISSGGVAVNSTPDGGLKIKSTGDGVNVLNLTDSSDDAMFNVRQSGNDCLIRGYKDGGTQTLQFHSDGESYIKGGSGGNTDLSLGGPGVTSHGTLVFNNGGGSAIGKIRAEGSDDSFYVSKLAGGGLFHFTSNTLFQFNQHVGIGITPTNTRLDVQHGSGNILRCKGDSGNTRFAVGASGACTIEANTGSYALDITNADSGKKGIRLADSVKTVWGNDADLQIYHDGSNSYIKDNGTGSLLIEVAGTGDSGFYKIGGEKLATFEPDGPVSLYHNNVKKFETTSYGVAINSRLEVSNDTDTYSVFGRVKIGYIGHGDYAGFSHIDAGGTGNYALIQSSAGATFLNSALNQSIFFRQNNTTFMVMTSGALYPNTDGAKDLGLNGNRWNNVYSEAGNFSGAVTTGRLTVPNDVNYRAANISEINSSISFRITKTRLDQTKAIAMGCLGSSNTDTGIQCYDTSNNSANTFSIQPFGGSITFNSAFTFPTTDGSANQVLKTNGSGTLSWADQSGGSYSLPTASTSTKGGIKIDGSDFTVNSSTAVMTLHSSVVKKYSTYVLLHSVNTPSEQFTVNHGLGTTDVMVKVKTAPGNTSGSTRAQRFSNEQGIDLDIGYDVEVCSCDSNGTISSNHVSFDFSAYEYTDNTYVYVTVMG